MYGLYRILYIILCNTFAIDNCTCIICNSTKIICIKYGEGVRVSYQFSYER